MDDKIDLADDGSNQAVASESQDNVGMVHVSNGTENVTESQPLTPTQSEVLIHGIVTIEKSPFNVLAQEELESIITFITSKDHMKKNIANIEFSHLSSRDSGGGMFTHRVGLKLSVKTLNLWETPRSYGTEQPDPLSVLLGFTRNYLHFLLCLNLIQEFKIKLNNNIEQ